jgi:hypothetical protein
MDGKQSLDKTHSIEHRDDAWLAKLKPEEWILEEYRLLSAHYFHEDGLYQGTIVIYATLNGGLLAFLGSSFVARESAALKLIPVVGIVLCTSWVATLVRIREWRNYIERRIQKIEEVIHKRWQFEELVPLDLRTVQDWNNWSPKRRWFNWPYLLFRNLPSSLMLLLLPFAFMSVWVFLLINRIRLRQ